MCHCYSLIGIQEDPLVWLTLSELLGFLQFRLKVLKQMIREISGEITNFFISPENGYWKHGDVWVLSKDLSDFNEIENGDTRSQVMKDLLYLDITVLLAIFANVRLV